MPCQSRMASSALYHFLFILPARIDAFSTNNWIRIPYKRTTQFYDVLIYCDSIAYQFHAEFTQLYSSIYRLVKKRDKATLTKRILIQSPLYFQFFQVSFVARCLFKKCIKYFAICHYLKRGLM